MQHYPPCEYVIWQGDLSTDMYFVVDGKLEVRINVQVADDISAGLDLQTQLHLHWPYMGMPLLVTGCSLFEKSGS